MKRILLSLTVIMGFFSSSIFANCPDVTALCLTGGPPNCPGKNLPGTFGTTGGLRCKLANQVTCGKLRDMCAKQYPDCAGGCKVQLNTTSWLYMSVVPCDVCGPMLRK